MTGLHYDDSLDVALARSGSWWELIEFGEQSLTFFFFFSFFSFFLLFSFLFNFCVIPAELIANGAKRSMWERYKEILLILARRDYERAVIRLADSFGLFSLDFNIAIREKYRWCSRMKIMIAACVLTMRSERNVVSDDAPAFCEPDEALCYMLKQVGWLAFSYPCLPSCLTYGIRERNCTRFRRIHFPRGILLLDSAFQRFGNWGYLGAVQVGVIERS